MKIITMTRNSFFEDLASVISNNLPVKISDFNESSPCHVNLDIINQILLENVRSEQVHYATCSSLENGRYFYNEKLNGFNFEHKSCSIYEFFGLLKEQIGKENKQYYAAQAIPVEVVFNESINAKLSCPELDFDLDTRLWIGNQCNTAAHFDFSHNIAHVLSGERVFTLYPPQEIKNLYIGPLSKSPGGTPISMVDTTNPDLKRYPRYQDALKQAITVKLFAGEAIFIPNLWWHSVQSLNDENLLLNYWWKNNQTCSLPYDSLIFLMSIIPSLPLEERVAWKSIFDYFVFQTDIDPTEHLPDNLYDVLMNLNKKDTEEIKQWFKSKL